MAQTIITAGDATSGGIVAAGGNDGTMVLQTGPAGGKVNALSFASDGTPTFVKSNFITLGTVQNTTSGTSIDFTSIPSWAKRITVMLNGVSTNGVSLPQIQLGAGSIDSASYLGSASEVSGATSTANFSSGILLQSGGNAASILYGSVTLINMGSSNWITSGNVGRSNTSSTTMVAGGKTLSGTLDRLRLTTVNGTDTFDAGSVNILIEG